MTGTARPEEVGGRKVGFAEVKLYMAQVDNRGQVENYLLAVAGDQVQVIDVKARTAADWLRNTLLERLAKRSNGGVEQA